MRPLLLAASSAATVDKKQPLNNLKRDMQQQLSSVPGRRAFSHRPDRGAGCLRCGAALTNAVHTWVHSLHHWYSESSHCCESPAWK